MTAVAYNRYDEAYRAIHSALMDITCPPPGRKITRIAFTYGASGNVSSLKAYDCGDLLFTLMFKWGVENTLSEVART